MNEGLNGYEKMVRQTMGMSVEWQKVSNFEVKRVYSISNGGIWYVVVVCFFLFFVMIFFNLFDKLK
jgi:hypothetical protein